MLRLADNAYARLRVDSGAVEVMRDLGDCPPEDLVQRIWQHQRLIAGKLRTLDGQTVRILHPGFQNLEGGPDFKGAVVQLGDESPLVGDIEVDLRSSGWKAHGHDRNPAFAKVILHVVWEAPENKPASGPKTLALIHALDAPVGQLSLWVTGESAQELPVGMRGKCSAAIESWTDEKLSHFLGEAGLVRLQSKATAFEARARQFGWDQALWEGLFRALGYKHNSWPMQCLAELRPRWLEGADGVFSLQARLFGISGLLPGDLPRDTAGNHRYIRSIWDRWWRERDAFSDCILPNALWRFHGLRPANHPQRRLALAAHWSVQHDLPAKLREWCSNTTPDRELERSLEKVLVFPEDPFWNWHWKFQSPRLANPQPLLGASRVTDLAMNVILPWLWARACEGGNDSLRRQIEHRYNAWPAGQDNSLLKHARRRMLGSSGKAARVFKVAVAQQGLIQITRDFCDRSNATCAGCRLPISIRN